jgi:hypothetical protein
LASGQRNMNESWPSYMRLVLEKFLIAPLNLVLLPSFDSYIYLIMCRLIPRTRLTLFLPTFWGTFLFLWFPTLQRFPSGIGRGRITLCQFSTSRTSS